MWESGAITICLGKEPPLTKWESFKNMIKSRFYHTLHEIKNDNMAWTRHRQGQVLQEFTMEFVKKVVLLEMCLNYDS